MPIRHRQMVAYQRYRPLSAVPPGGTRSSTPTLIGSRNILLYPSNIMNFMLTYPKKSYIQFILEEWAWRGTFGDHIRLQNGRQYFKDWPKTVDKLAMLYTSRKKDLFLLYLSKCWHISSSLRCKNLVTCY